MPKVSVVIPVYNVEPWLPACLDSVLAQTLKDIEIICIDDASPDGCPAILDAYAARHPNLRAVHLEKNRRQGFGRNRGMDLASGEYIYFLDSDDMIAPEALEELCRAADADRLDGVFFDSTRICEDPALERYALSYQERWTGAYPEGVMKGADFFGALMGNGEWTCYVQREFWRLDFLRREGVRFPDDVEHEDELFAFEAILLARRVRYLRRPYFLRRYREHSVMTTPPTARNFHGYFMNFVLMAEFLRERGITSVEARTNVARMYERMTRFYAELSGKEDLTGWFKPEQLPFYRFFAASQDAPLYYRQLRPGLEERLRAYGEIQIYGAGAVARTACRALALRGFAVEGFVVTDRAGNPDVLEGRRVRTVDELRPGPGRVLLTAMTRRYEDEVWDRLRGAGWDLLSFRGRGDD